MAGTALNFDTTEITNVYGWCWVGLAIPGAGARITLHTDGTPDATANPNAKHLGHTIEGWELNGTMETEDVNVDESATAVKSSPVSVNASLAAALAQTTDISTVLRYVVQGFGTYATASGYEEITIGLIPIVYTPVALIWPTEADVTKFAVYNLYRSYNNAGLHNEVRRRGIGSNPVVMQGYALTSRASTDTTGNYWKMIA